MWIDFAKFFHQLIHWKILYVYITKISTTLLMQYVCESRISKKMFILTASSANC